MQWRMSIVDENVLFLLGADSNIVSQVVTSFKLSAIFKISIAHTKTIKTF